MMNLSARSALPHAVAVAAIAATLAGGALSARPVRTTRIADDTLVAWRIGGRAPHAKARRDTTQKHGGSASGHLAAGTQAPDIVASADRGGRGGAAGQQGPRVRPVKFEQTINAIPYRERRLRVSLWVRTKLPDKPSKGMPVSQAHGYIQVDNEDGTVSVYDGSMSPIYGATEWTRKFMVIEVPPDAYAISFGVSLLGPGEVWVDDALLEDQSPASGSYVKQPLVSAEMMQRATPEQLAHGKEMLARRIAGMKERPAEVVNGDFETR
jgi:hypothetical protein